MTNRIDSKFKSLLTILIVIVLGGVAFYSLRPKLTRSVTPPAVPEPLAPLLGYEIVNTYPHDPSCYTQGLLIKNGVFYESCGLYEQSSLRKVEPETGKVLAESNLDASYFAEGLTLLDGKLYQLTWQENTGFVYNAQNLEALETFHYQTQGWGLTTDGSALLLSDGSNTLFWLDPTTFQVVRQVKVTYQQQPVEHLNELEYIKGMVFANIYLTDTVAVINPEDGSVVSLIDLSGLRPEQNLKVQGEVLNGIAYDDQTDKLYVTGKNWPLLYEIRLISNAVPTPAKPR